MAVKLPFGGICSAYKWCSDQWSSDLLSEPIYHVDHGEFHMGATMMEFILPKWLCGVERFYNTHGSLEVCCDSVIIFDYDELLLIDIQERAPWYWRSDAGYHFWRCAGQKQIVVANDKDHQFVVNRDQMSPGLGPIKEGRFSSALSGYKPTPLAELENFDWAPAGKYC